MGRFHNALYLGDVRKRLRLPEGAGEGGTHSCWLALLFGC